MEHDAYVGAAVARDRGEALRHEPGLPEPHPQPLEPRRGDPDHGQRDLVLTLVLLRVADPTLQNIGLVELTLPDGGRRTFVGSGGPTAPGPNAAWRTMDCIDCHNRPSHIYVRAAAAVDDAIQNGRIDRSLPFVHREGLRLLQVDYPSQQAARDAIRKGLVSFYAQRAPTSRSGTTAMVEAAASELGDIRAQNVWPEMKITWGTYPTFIGHLDAPGCFRCHDGHHSSKDGKSTIPDDCELCHALLAQEHDPKILKELRMVNEPSR